MRSKQPRAINDPRIYHVFRFYQVVSEPETQGSYGHYIEVNTASTSTTTASINLTAAEPVTTVSAPVTTAGVSVGTADPSTPP
nr:hypothetical protein [Tanacetum cinerariifolium]